MNVRDGEVDKQTMFDNTVGMTYLTKVGENALRDRLVHKQEQ